MLLECVNNICALYPAAVRLWSYVVVSVVHSEGSSTGSMVDVIVTLPNQTLIVETALFTHT